jgi:hypothetical protein
MLVPAGGLGADGCTWIEPPRRKQKFLVPVHALAKHFRGRFLHLARRAVPDIAFPEIPWGKNWVVFAKPVVQGAEKILEYLGRYVHRTATSDRAIVACGERSVTFGYLDSGDGRRKTMTLAADEFLRRFLQHVPPKGFHRVRAFGLLHPEHRDTLRRLQLLLAPRRPSKPAAPPPARKPLTCPHCKGGPLRLVRHVDPSECVALDNAARALAASLARAPPAPLVLTGGALP